MSASDLLIDNWIDGQSRPALSGERLAVHEPATGKIYAEVADSAAADVALAVDAATRAFAQWSQTPSGERARLLEALAALIERDHEALAQAESRDTGKPIDLARRVDIPRAVANLRFFAAAATQFASEAHHGAGAGFNVTLRQPLGAVACISPWNLPLYLLTWKIAPALAAGNTVIAKPSEITPRSAALLGELSREAGFAPGVLNLVQGSGDRAGQALVEHPQVKAISFTGSTATGRRIAAAAAPRLAKLSLELGGKNPYLIFADADLERAADTALAAAFTNQGQICLCASRILIEARAYAAVREKLIAGMADWQPADPALAGTRFGALVSGAHYDKVLAYFDRARAEGGRIVAGGHALALAGRNKDGWFVAPTLIENLGPDSALNREEIFGPVATLQPFDNLDHALRLANASDYGLAGSVWTGSLAVAQNVAARLECGIVWINTWMTRDLRTPFGGSKQSGLGREGGLEAMRFFTETRNICLADPP